MADFSDSIVNQRFRLVYEDLLDKKTIKGKSDIADKLGTYNHVINSILKGSRNVTIEQLAKLFDTYHISADYMFGLGGSMYRGGQRSSDRLPSVGMDQRSFEGRRNIALLDVKAQAGDRIDLNDRAFVEGLQRFSLPGMEGQLFAIEITGDSMMPTLTNGDLVVCEPVEGGGQPNLQDNHVYIVWTDQVVAKRVQPIKEGKDLTALRLISDNEIYRPYTIELQDVRNILKVKCRITHHAIS